MRESFASRFVIASVLALAGCGGETVGDRDAGHDATVDRDGGRTDAGGNDRDGGALEDAASLEDGGIDVDSGRPGESCGGLLGAMCAEDEYCDYSEGCGIADGTGVCRQRPLECPDFGMPVCGCDGRTYGNACEAFAAGADVLYDGACAAAPCAPQDARGEGLCDMILGVAWDGAACVYLSGCSCVGADCGSLYATMDACTAARGACAATACGTRGAGPCRDDQFCDFPDGAMCGAFDWGGVCMPRPGMCPDLYAPVCGCDGVTYGNACEAHAAGVDSQRDGACEGSCDPQDASGVGDCRAIWGWAWDGRSCVSITGCECVGTDCSSLWATEGECVVAHERCGAPSGCGGLLGLTCADTAWCDYPDGAFCGAADMTGTCQPRPSLCTGRYDPVCGCDGRTHGNECEANAAGTDVASRGPCAPVGGCTVEGCRGRDVCCACTGLCYDDACLGCCPACS